MRRHRRPRPAGAARRGRRRWPCPRLPARSAARRGAAGRATRASSKAAPAASWPWARRHRGDAGPRLSHGRPAGRCTAAQTCGLDRVHRCRRRRSGRSAPARRGRWPRKPSRSRWWKARPLALEPHLAAARAWARAQARLRPAGRRSASGPAASRPAPARSSAVDQRRDRSRRRRPGRRGWSSAKRSQTTQAPRSSAGRITRSRWSRRAAYISSVSVDGRPAVGGAVQHQLADGLGARRAAGLAGGDHLAGPAPRRRATRRFSWVDLPGPLPAFEGDEPPARHARQDGGFASDVQRQRRGSEGAARTGRRRSPRRPPARAGRRPAARLRARAAPRDRA